MTPHNRILVVVGGAAVIVSLTIAVIFVQADVAAAGLEADTTIALRLQTLSNQLLTDVRDQHEAIDQYLMSADVRPLARYRLAVMDETRTASQIVAASEKFARVADALVVVATENTAWRATVAEPAIAAVQSGSVQAVKAAIQTEIRDQEASLVSTSSQFILEVDAMAAELRVRSDALNDLRVTTTAFGVAIELLAAGVSLWFVRRYGLRVSRDTRRRVQASAERLEIVASLRTLRAQETAEATAATIAAALHRLPGVDVAGLYECTKEGLRALAIVAMPGFPFMTGETIPAERARYLRQRSAGGPWAEPWIQPAEPNADDERITELGIKARAFAPIRADGELIGLIGVATAHEDHWQHLLEDLPAVGEFASVAETILAPDLVIRRDHTEKRQWIAATIASGAFLSVFQPIVDVATGTTVGFEALTRFDDGSRPDLRFAAAKACGMGIELETVTLKAALRDASDLPPGAWLSLNVSPALLARRGILVPMLADFAGPVVLEVTEHDVVEAYPPLREAMMRLGPGVRLAVDDVGAGVANFHHLVELRPDFIKIDVSLVRGVDADLHRQAVIVGLIHFAAEARCQVIAEGIETEAERATLAKLGVTLGQGYLLAAPAPAETWSVAIQKRGNEIMAQQVKRPPRGDSLLTFSRAWRPGPSLPATIGKARHRGPG
jgi:EAL domain-containing protein (putative c-di-GMP-specific phosphodiesterase class I)